MTIYSKWARLVGQETDHGYELVLFDSDGNQRSQRGPQVPFPWGRLFSVFLPQNLEETLREIAGPPDTRPGLNGPIPLALFVDVPDNLQFLAWERLFTPRRWPPFPDELPLSVVRAAQGPILREPLALPLRLLSIGMEPFSTVQGEHWFGEALDLQALEIDAAPSFESSLLKRPDPPHLISVRGSQLPSVIDAITECSLEARPSLIVARAPVSPTALLRPRPGTALLVIRDEAYEEVSHEIIMGIVHNLPLHEILYRWFVDRVSLPGDDAILWATPSTNESLLLAPVADRFIENATALSSQIQIGDVYQNRLALPAETVAVLERVQEQQNVVDQFRRDTMQFHADFERESRGLIPLAHATRQMKEAKEAVARMKEALEEIRKEEPVQRLLREKQERRLDLTLLGWQDHFRRSVYKHLTLARSSSYRLRANIGFPAEESLTYDEATPIDPLLPDTEESEGYDLDIVVFEKNFILESPRAQRIHLDRFGASTHAYFDIETPKELGVAQLRVSIYHRNQLLQSYVLSSEVRESEEYSEELGLRVEMDFCQSETFANVFDLSERTISLAVNDDPRGTHQLMIKERDVAAQYEIPEQLQEHTSKRFRQLLESAKVAYDEQHDEDLELSDEVFAEQLLASASLGRKIYNWLRAQDLPEELEETIDEIRDRERMNLQVARVSTQFVFPWPLIYDYGLPLCVPNEVLPVCYGEALNDAEIDQNAVGEVGCPHNPGKRVVCCEGFWGVRHWVEQLGRSKKNTKKVVRTTTDGRGTRNDLITADATVACANATIQDHAPWVVLTRDHEYKSATDLAEKLTQQLEKDFDTLDSAGIWARMLFGDAVLRPAIFASIGHLKKETVGGEPNEERILTVHDVANPRLNQWITSGAIGQVEKLKTAPHPLVLLLACESGVVELESLTDLVTHFLGKGVAAVVGSEATIRSDFAARFVRHIVTQMYDEKRCLGEAIRSFNKRLLMKEKCPMPFIFTAYGSSDLTIDSV